MCTSFDCSLREKIKFNQLQSLSCGFFNQFYDIKQVEKYRDNLIGSKIYSNLDDTHQITFKFKAINADKCRQFLKQTKAPRD